MAGHVSNVFDSSNTNMRRNVASMVDSGACAATERGAFSGVRGFAVAKQVSKP